MPSSPTISSLPESAAVSSRARRAVLRPARARVLPVAEIYAVQSAERNGSEIIVALTVGDEANPPKRHGLRAPMGRWLQIVKALAAEDEDLRDQMRDALRSAAIPEPAVLERPPVTKPSGQIL